jgi:hypothetical protein
VKESALRDLAPFTVFAAAVWLPLFPALAFGKSGIPGPDIRKLVRRAAWLSVAAGLPVMFALLVVFSRISHDPPPLSDLLVRCGTGAVAFLPLYGALIATSVFQARHRADKAVGNVRPLAVRFLAGAVILAVNLLAGMIMFFVLFAITGVYRGWS